MYLAPAARNNLSADSLVLGPRRSEAVLARTLDQFVAAADRAALVRGDPVELVWRYADPHDQEVAGLLVAMLAYGRVASIKAKASEALERLGPSPAAAVDGGRRLAALRGFVHRFQRGNDLERFLRAARRVRRQFGSLGAAFRSGAGEGEPHFGAAMGRFVGLLAGAVEGEPSYGLRFLLPDATSGGAAKRLCLYLRWMIRPADGLDLGTWQHLAPGLDPARLVIPLDTHIARLARYLGLTERKSQDLATALEITASLRRLRPADPLYYDMALCHLGVSGACPRKRSPKLCGDCPIRAVCRLGPEPKGWPYRG